MEHKNFLPLKNLMIWIDLETSAGNIKILSEIKFLNMIN